MKTRNSSAGTTLQGQGRLFRRAKQSPCCPAPKGKHSLQKLKMKDDSSANQSPVSAEKKDHSQLENVKENCISLHEALSPIIKRRTLGQNKLSDLSNVCRDPSSGSQRSEKDKKAPLQIISSSQENQVFPLEERMNGNMFQKGKEMKEDRKKQAVRKKSVISDKENVLSTHMTQAPVRKSKRIRVAPKSKDVIDVLKPVMKNPLNKKQKETKNVLEADKLSKEEASSSEAGNKQADPQPKPKRVTGAKSLKTHSSAAQQSNVTAQSGGKEESDRSCDRTHVATSEKSSCNEKESASTNRDTTVLLRRTKRKSSQQDKDDIAKKAKTGNNDETPKVPGTSTRTIRSVSSAKVDETKGLSRKLLRRSHNISQNKESPSTSGCQGVTQAKSKPPVWASVKGIKITPGKRKSFRINSDTYDFPSSPHEELAEVKRKKVKKSKKQMKKRVKPRTKFTLLITDPSWQRTTSKRMPLLGESSLSTTNRSTASTRYLDDNSEMDAADEASVPSIMSSIRDEEPAEEDFSGFELEGSHDLFLGFEGETRSSFVIPSKNRNGNELVPMTSASVLPTPAISKHISKYIGGSSTPRMENLTGAAGNKKTRTANDSISECFGFNDSEEECELNISPVQQSRQRSALDVTGTSDMTDGELHPATLPSRFSWSSLRPGNRSRASASRSSSMVAQGRSVTFMTNVSQNSQTKITSFAVPTVSKRHPMQRREKPTREEKTTGQDELRDTLSTEADPSDKIEAAEMSVLFDDEELKEDKEPSKTSHPNNKASQVSAKASDKSPEKSFVKAPRRSYDRTSLLEARRKFIEMHGGYADIEDGSSSEEEEEEEQAAQVKLRSKARKKPTKVTKPAKVNKKKEKKSAKAAEGDSKKTAASTSISKKKKKKMDEFDATLEDWASRINSHFSEVDESLLVVE
ncbi:hypothetical protein O3P69_004403 [Scylla paramamosain]|uniref:Uncharacterized protein n=2 Tax=Scylla paramamosain TaxID=85552 RepID=A0AAW0UF87_SCYPA